MKPSMPVILVLVSLASAGVAVEADALVTVTVQGTRINRLPKFVNILVAKPDEEAARLVRKGGKANPEFPVVVSSQDVDYVFTNPKEWKTQGERAFNDGDVIYTYYAESKQESDSFVERYGLKPWDKLVEKDGASSVYLASPGYYVMVQTPQIVYACGMHPKTQATEAGHCPICGMDLVKMKVYK